MNSILIRHVLLNDKKTNILIRGNRFEATDASETAEASQIIEGEGLAILPAFYNTHTHAAMTLLRGYADDMPLQTWLQDHIWPYEATMTAEDIRRGSAMAIREMTETGSVFFCDMYFAIDGTIAEAAQAGIRAAVGVTFLDGHPLCNAHDQARRLGTWQDMDGRITLTAAPHAIYTVGTESLQTAARLARENGKRITIHLSETRKEVEDCIKAHGTTPVRYLDSIGFLGPDVIAAHCVYIDPEEWDIMAARGVTVSHCPCSNMKLGSGRFPYEEAIRSGVRMTLGTDGCSSNNNLDMREEMKTAALLAKVQGDPSLLPAQEVMKWATVNGAEAFGIHAGVIARGKLADALLIDLSVSKMQPCHNLISNWVYAADTSCIRTVICDGKILMP